MSNRIEVKSNMFKSVGFQACLGSEPGTLYVEFSQGTLYKFFQVPQETYRELCAADSMGQYFNEHIRGKYKSEKIQAESEPADKKE
jgi:KTSC domain